MTEDKEKHPVTRKKRHTKKDDRVSKMRSLINILTGKKGLIFISIITALSVLEIVFKTESSALSILKTILQYIFFLS
ncbi:MAG: hypothetical protein N3A54_00550 [Patescibacteria group bacterium]|nr:hypothetical protein [Patescibacteria group bacterium]